MITLTTSIAVPNITRIRVLQVLLFDSASTAKVQVRVQSGGGTPRSKDFELAITNGATPEDTSETLDQAPAPTTFDGDVVPGARVRVVNGYDQVEAAYRGAANKAAAMRAVEQLLLTLQVIRPALVGTVS